MTNTNTASDLDEQLLIDIVTTAVEGGISYWAAGENYDPDAGTISIIVDDDGERYELDTSVIRKAIEALAASKAMAPRFHQQAVDMLAGDEVDFDADTADVLTQIGLFGEVTYA